MDAPRLDSSPIVVVQDEFDAREVIGDAAPLTLPAENLLVFLERWVRNFDLVADSAQEGFVHQAGWLQVGGEDDELVEGDGYLLPGSQVEVILSLLERNNPAIQQVAR